MIGGELAAAYQAVPVDSLAESLRRVQPIQFEQTGGLPEGIQLAATVLSIGAAAFAAWAGWQAVRAARRANSDQNTWRDQDETDRQTWRRVEREHVYYDAIVAGPVLDAIRNYGHRIREVLGAGEQHVRNLQISNAGALDVKNAVTELLSVTFASEHNAMTQAITEAAEAWPDDELREAIRKAAERASEAVAEEGAKLLDPHLPVNFDAVLNDALGAARRVVMDHDPALKAIRE